MIFEGVAGQETGWTAARLQRRDAHMKSHRLFIRQPSGVQDQQQQWRLQRDVVAHSNPLQARAWVTHARWEDECALGRGKVQPYEAPLTNEEREPFTR